MENGDEDESKEYISSYNYYLYYNSIRPRDPRLPKPLYKPMPDMDFIKGGTHDNIREEDEDDLQKDHVEDASTLMNNLSLTGERKTANSVNNSSFTNFNNLNNYNYNSSLSPNVYLDYLQGGSSSSGMEKKSPMDYYNLSTLINNEYILY